MFTKESFGTRLKETGYLLKHSFTIANKDKDIVKPTIRMGILSVILTTIIFACILSFFIGKFIFIGVIVLLFTILILLPLRVFYDTRQKANQSWTVYNTIIGKDISYKDAKKHTSKHIGKIRGIAFVDMLIKFGKSQARNRKGNAAGMIVKLFMSALSEVWDLLSHFMIPAVVIEEKKLSEIVPDIKKLKNNVPATLMGVFGLDFAGKALASLFNGIYLIALVASVGLGYLMAEFGILSSTVFTIDTFSFSWVPILAMMYVVMIIGGVYKKVVESVKIIYFTIFYTAIQRPKELIPEIKKGVASYLMMGKDQK